MATHPDTAVITKLEILVGCMPSSDQEQSGSETIWVKRSCVDIVCQGGVTIHCVDGEFLAHTDLAQMVPEDPEKAYYAVQRNAGCSVIFEVKRDGTNHEYLKVLADLMEWLQTPVAESELFQC